MRSGALAGRIVPAAGGRVLLYGGEWLQLLAKQLGTGEFQAPATGHRPAVGVGLPGAHPLTPTMHAGHPLVGESGDHQVGPPQAARWGRLEVVLVIPPPRAGTREPRSTP